MRDTEGDPPGNGLVRHAGSAKRRSCDVRWPSPPARSDQLTHEIDDRRERRTRVLHQSRGHRAQFVTGDVIADSSERC
jgi:hypothetical protein